jgi:hypothetical protein
MLAIVGGRPVHVVASTDPAMDRTFAITAYVPDSDLWEADFKTRRKR